MFFYEGVGFPSCCRDLVRIPPNTSDVNSYYADLGLPPWASDREIRAALRRQLRVCHPDGSFPDEQRYRRLLIIREALCTPHIKAAYDSTPAGGLFVDDQIKEGLLATVPAELLSAFLTPVEPEPTEGYFGFYSDGDEFDVDLAQRWYRALVSVAPLFGYRYTLVLVLHDGPAAFKKEGRVVLVPRSWTPSTATAFALFAVVICPRHAAA